VNRFARRKSVKVVIPAKAGIQQAFDNFLASKLDPGFAAQGEPHSGERAIGTFALDFGAKQGLRSDKVRIPRSARMRGSGRRGDEVFL